MSDITNSVDHSVAKILTPSQVKHARLVYLMGISMMTRGRKNRIAWDVELVDSIFAQTLPTNRSSALIVGVPCTQKAILHAYRGEDLRKTLNGRVRNIAVLGHYDDTNDIVSQRVIPIGPSGATVFILSATMKRDFSGRSTGTMNYPRTQAWNKALEVCCGFGKRLPDIDDPGMIFRRGIPCNLFDEILWAAKTYPKGNPRSLVLSAYTTASTDP